VRPWQKAAARCLALAPVRAPRPPRVVREREARALQLRWRERQRAREGQGRLEFRKAVGE
jgi:hypothetical protein